MVITQGKFVHCKSLKELFIFEQNVGFLFNALGFLFPPFALLNDKVLQPDDKVLSRVTSIHFVRFSYSDPHVQAELLLPSGDHILFLGPGNRDENIFGKVHYR